MDFLGPSAADYENVASLNRGFLALVPRAPRRCLGGLREDLGARLRARTLVPDEGARIAETSFAAWSASR